MAAFEMAFDYVDCLSEMPSTDPIANGRQLSRALIVAVTPNQPHSDYYARHALHDDGGYLRALVQTCRDTLALLPAHRVVGGPVRCAARRIAQYQTYNHGDAGGSHEAFARWAQHRHAASTRTDLYWWEYAAAYGSSLLVFALIAAASHLRTRLVDVRLIEHAYFPWIGAANSLLDSLVDQAEDAAPGHHRLLDYYTAVEEAHERLQWIVEEAIRRSEALDSSQGHALIAAAMVSFYLTDPGLKAFITTPAYQAIHRSTRGFARPTMWVMRARRAVPRSFAKQHDIRDAPI